MLARPSGNGEPVASCSSSALIASRAPSTSTVSSSSTAVRVVSGVWRRNVRDRYAEVAGALAQLAHRDAQAPAVQHEGDGQHRQADPEVLDADGRAGAPRRPPRSRARRPRRRCRRPPAAPRIALRVVAERVSGVGRAAAATQGDREQHLVAGVGHRVERLGHQRGRAGQRRRDALRDRDRDVGDQRGGDRAAAAGGRGARSGRAHGTGMSRERANWHPPENTDGAPRCLGAPSVEVRSSRRYVTSAIVPPGPSARRAHLPVAVGCVSSPSAHAGRGDQRRSVRTLCGSWLAWLSMAVPAWLMICSLVRLTISLAMSVSRTRLSEACRFSW